MPSSAQPSSKTRPRVAHAHGVLREEEHRHGVVALIRQDVPAALRLLAEEMVRHLEEDARAVARGALEPRSAAVLEVYEHRERVVEDLVAARAVDVGERADAAGVVLELRSIEGAPPCGGGAGVRHVQDAACMCSYHARFLHISGRAPGRGVLLAPRRRAARSRHRGDACRARRRVSGRRRHRRRSPFPAVCQRVSVALHLGPPRPRAPAPQPVAPRASRAPYQRICAAPCSFFAKGSARAPRRRSRCGTLEDVFQQ